MKTIPIAVKRSMARLGANIKDARRRRRIPVSLMAERANMSRTTLNKIEKGDATVSIGLYASVLFVLGLHKSLEQIGDLAFDEAGRLLEEENLPERIRLSSGKKGKQK